MAQIIDAFITTLGLDGTLFRRGMRDAERDRRRLDDITTRGNRNRETQERAGADAQRRRHREQEERTKAVALGYRKIRNEVLGLAAVFTAGMGLKDFITSSINGAASLGFLSANLSMSTEALTSWQRASERAGGSAEGIVAQLKESADTLAQLKSGMGPNEGLQSFFRWGGNSSELKDGNSYLLERSRIISELFKVDPAQAALISKSMGISEDQFDFLKQGPTAVMAMVQAQEKNAVVSAKNAAAALELKNKALDLRDSLQATSVKVLTALLPSLTKLADWLISITSHISDNKDVIAGWVESFIKSDWSHVIGQAKEFATAVASIAENLARLMEKIDKWTGGNGTKDMIPTTMGGLSSKLLKDGSEDKGKSGFWQSAKMGIARTLASFGDRTAGEYVRDKTGKDDYRVGPASKKPETKSVMSKLMAQGWTAEQAAGITGSLMQESGLDHTARNPKSGAYGIAQWLSKDRVGNFRKVMGRDLVGSSLDEQLAFHQYEMTKGSEQAAGRKLRGTRTAEEAARVHSEEYERPGTAEANIARRQRLAAQLISGQRAANAAAAGSMPAGAQASISATNNRSSSSTSETKIENINVYTQATDAAAIARDIRPAVEKFSFTTQANTGMR